MQLAGQLTYESPRLPPSPPEAAVEAVELTLLCCDVVGFTRMTVRLGDAESLAVMRSVASAVRSLALRYGGQVLEIRGDSFLLAFGVTVDAMHCATRLPAAVERRTERDRVEVVRLRTALHTGTVLRDGESYFGRNLILPFRLLSEIDPEEIAVTRGVATSLPAAWQRCVDLGRCFEPKGLDEVVDSALVDASTFCDDTDDAFESALRAVRSIDWGLGSGAEAPEA